MDVRAHYEWASVAVRIVILADEVAAPVDRDELKVIGRAVIQAPRTISRMLLF